MSYKLLLSELESLSHMSKLHYFAYFSKCNFFLSFLSTFLLNDTSFSGSFFFFLGDLIIRPL